MKRTLFKSTINGIGSGAGVAWPFFGIVFTLVGGAIGSGISIALGSLALGLFLSICITIDYFSYKQAQEEQTLFQVQFKKNKNKAISDLQQYIETIQLNYFSQRRELAFKDYFSLKLEELNHLEKSIQKAPLYQCLRVLKEKTNQLNLVPPAKWVVKSLSKIVPPANNSNKKACIAAFFDFVGTFGSIAGCSAGFSGMLTGVGLFTSFAAFPVIGWSVIGIASAAGLLAATLAFKLSKEQSRKNELNRTYKSIHKELSDFNRRNNSDPRLQIGDPVTEEVHIKKTEAFLSQPSILSAPLKFFTPFLPKRPHAADDLLSDSSKCQPIC